MNDSSLVSKKGIIFRSRAWSRRPGRRLGSALMVAFTACFLSACYTRPPATEPTPRPAPPPAPGSAVEASWVRLPGADTPRGAVERFFRAVKAQDLQAMALAWGTAKGPAAGQMSQDELERRELVMLCYFTNDSYSVPRESAVGRDAQRVFRVSLTKGNLRATPAVYTVQGPNARWYVENLEIAAVRDFCPQQSR